MKKIIISIFLVGMLFISGTALAKVETANQPNKTNHIELILSNSLRAIWDEIKLIKKQIAEIKLKKCPKNNSCEEGLKKSVYIGTVPNNLEDADMDVHIQGGDDDHYYFKKVEIPEIQLSNMPNLNLYVKIDDEIGDLIEEDLWEINNSSLYIKDGLVYIRYANDNEDGIHYYFPDGGDYKIVIIY